MTNDDTNEQRSAIYRLTDEYFERKDHGATEEELAKLAELVGKDGQEIIRKRLHNRKMFKFFSDAEILSKTYVRR